MHSIHIQNLVASYLYFHPEKNSVSLEVISNIGEELIASMRAQHLDVYLESHRDAVINMLQINPDIFEKNDEMNEIILINRKELNKEMFFYFNAKLALEIRETYIKLIEVLCQKA